MKNFAWLAALALACPAAQAAQTTAPAPSARDFSHAQVIPITNGPNAIDIDGDGRNDLVFDAHRDNFNAHSFEHITFYLQVAPDTGKTGASAAKTSGWNVVPFFSKEGPQFVAFDTVEGADCWLRDMVLLRNLDGSVTMIVADRDMGTSYADKAHMNFSIYRVAYNKEGLAGSPPVYFQRTDHFQGKHLYCDADHAIAAELGVKFKPGLEDNGIDH